jgi:hypothetical protein
LFCLFGCERLGLWRERQYEDRAHKNAPWWCNLLIAQLFHSAGLSHHRAGRRTRTFFFLPKRKFTMASHSQSRTNRKTKQKTTHTHIHIRK